ncbi:MAG: imidazole glycerol phosphate synthase subunit HisH [Ruminococcaceae bacterium]|nr:imidazole glycerol phosphate synthase subunit HisH [Oscillospiraceae bacterium]
MIAIINYGVGNLFSLSGSLKRLGIESVVTADENVIRNADRIILPGVGAFGDAAEKLRKSGLDKVIIDEAKKGKPLMGICLGMQMLFEKSYEYGEHEGLGLIPGNVKPMKPLLDGKLKVPHIGWNSLQIKDKNDPLLKYIEEGDYVYYVHSFYATDCDAWISSTSEYGITVTGSVRNGNVWGTQFHPEKSGEKGLLILKAFSEI